MTTLALVKYAVALAGIFLVILSDSGGSWVGYLGLGLIVVAFLLRFAKRDAPQ